jgi:hypothetical protein
MPPAAEKSRHNDYMLKAQIICTKALCKNRQSFWWRHVVSRAEAWQSSGGEPRPPGISQGRFGGSALDEYVSCFLLACCTLSKFLLVCVVGIHVFSRSP